MIPVVTGCTNPPRLGWLGSRPCDNSGTTMIHLPPDFREFVQLLNEHNAEYIGYQELLKNKRAAGREKDLADVAELQKRNNGHQRSERRPKTAD